MDPLGIKTLYERFIVTRQLSPELLLEIQALKEFLYGSPQLETFHDSLPGSSLMVYKGILEGTINQNDRENVLKLYQSQYEITKERLEKAFDQALKKQPRNGNTAFESNCRHIITNFDDMELFHMELRKTYEFHKAKSWDTMAADDLLPFIIEVFVHAQDTAILQKVVRKLANPNYSHGIESYFLVTMQIAIHKIME